MHLIRHGIFYALFISYGFTACKSTQHYNIELEHDASVGSQLGALDSKKKGDLVSIKDNPIYIIAPNREPMLIVPVAPNGGTIKVALAQKNTAESSSSSQEQLMLAGNSGGKANERVAKIIVKILDAQNALAQNQLNNAKILIDETMRDNPDLSYAYFLKASASALEGNKDDAIASLERALQDFPNDQNGLALYRDLTGKQYEGPKNQNSQP